MTEEDVVASLNLPDEEVEAGLPFAPSSYSSEGVLKDGATGDEEVKNVVRILESLCERHKLRWVPEIPKYDRKRYEVLMGADGTTPFALDLEEGLSFVLSARRDDSNNFSIVIECLERGEEKKRKRLFDSYISSQEQEGGIQEQEGGGRRTNCYFLWRETPKALRLLPQDLRQKLEGLEGEITELKAKEEELRRFCSFRSDTGRRARELQVEAAAARVLEMIFLTEEKMAKEINGRNKELNTRKVALNFSLLRQMLEKLAVSPPAVRDIVCSFGWPAEAGEMKVADVELLDSTENGSLVKLSYEEGDNKRRELIFPLSRVEPVSIDEWIKLVQQGGSARGLGERITRRMASFWQIFGFGRDIRVWRENMERAYGREGIIGLKISQNQEEEEALPIFVFFDPDFNASSIYFASCLQKKEKK